MVVNEGKEMLKYKTSRSSRKMKLRTTLSYICLYQPVSTYQPLEHLVALAHAPERQPLPRDIRGMRQDKALGRPVAIRIRRSDATALGYQDAQND